MLLESPSEPRSGILISIFKDDTVKVVVRLQLQNGIYEGEGLVGGWVVPFVDDLEYRAGDVLLAVGRDVRSRLSFNHFCHSPKKGCSDSSTKSLDWERGDPFELCGKFFSGFEGFVLGDEVLPEVNCLFGVLKSGLDHD